MTTRKELIEENKKLKDLLSSAKSWMKREIKSQMHSLFKKNNHENITEEELTEKIYNFFDDTLLLNVPDAFIENLIIAEINFNNMQ